MSDIQTLAMLCSVFEAQGTPQDYFSLFGPHPHRPSVFTHHHSRFVSPPSAPASGPQPGGLSHEPNRHFVMWVFPSVLVSVSMALTVNTQRKPGTFYQGFLYVDLQHRQQSEKLSKGFSCLQSTFIFSFELICLHSWSPNIWQVQQTHSPSYGQSNTGTFIKEVF